MRSRQESAIGNRSEHAEFRLLLEPENVEAGRSGSAGARRRERMIHPNSGRNQIFPEWILPMNLNRFAALLSFSLLAFGSLSGCKLCGTKTLEEIVSPDGKRIAAMVTRDCGAMTSEYIAVNIRDIGEQDLDGDKDVFVIRRLHTVTISWERNDQLAIDCVSCDLSKAEKKLKRLGPVEITYSLN